MSNIKKYVREFSTVNVTSKIIFNSNEVEDLLEKLEDEAFWSCTARAEKHKGIEMW